MQSAPKGLRIIVTAGAGGIGQAIAEAFLENGARVHICDVVEERLAGCQAAWPELGTSLADVSDPVQVDRLFEAATRRLGGLDVLVNNAGIAGPTAPVEEVAPELWERTMAVNINGQFFCARRAVPLLKMAGGGSIVNISSTAGLMGYPLRSPYAASKWAVIGLTKTLAMELGQFGIRVNAICPGPIKGPRMEAVMAAQATARGVTIDLVHEETYRQTSMRTFIDRRDIAALVLFLCSRAGAKITGQALAVDGHTETLR
jgi:NAD(P)-dependent dehydrogenase (short-subunit alcohol dehydrogenase family)